MQILEEPRLISETEDVHLLDTFLISTKPNEANWRINKDTAPEKVKSFEGTDFFIIPESIFSGEGQPGHPINGTVEDQLAEIRKNSHGKIVKIKGPYPYNDGTDDFYYRANVKLNNSLAASTLIENGSKTWVPFAVSPQIQVLDGPDDNVTDWKAMGLGLVIKGAYGEEAVVHKYCNGSNHVCSKTLSAAIQDVISSLVSNNDNLNIMSQTLQTPIVTDIPSKVETPVIEQPKEEKKEQITLTKDEYDTVQKQLKEQEELKTQLAELTAERNNSILNQVFGSIQEESIKTALFEKYGKSDVKLVKSVYEDVTKHIVPSLVNKALEDSKAEPKSKSASILKPEPKRESNESKSASIVPNSVNEVKRFERLMREGY